MKKIKTVEEQQKIYADTFISEVSKNLPSHLSYNGEDADASEPYFLVDFAERKWTTSDAIVKRAIKAARKYFDDLLRVLQEDYDFQKNEN